jgi:hypothetical protein
VTADQGSCQLKKERKNPFGLRIDGSRRLGKKKKGKTRGLFMTSAGHFLIELGPQ